MRDDILFGERDIDRLVSATALKRQALAA